MKWLYQASSVTGVKVSEGTLVPAAVAQEMGEGDGPPGTPKTQKNIIQYTLVIFIKFLMEQTIRNANPRW